MKLLSDAIKDKEFDVRMVNTNINRGVISRGDHDKALKSLSDDSNLCDFVSVEEIERSADGDLPSERKKNNV